MNENAYRARAERGHVQIGTWATMIRTPAILTLRQAAGLDFARVDMECAHYAPLGERGMYGFGPHTMYRTLPPSEHMATANARVHVTAMLETKRAFERLDEIASVPGLHALTIGPTDLPRTWACWGRRGSARSWTSTVTDWWRRPASTARRWRC